MSAPPTSISGTVFAPNGTLPLWGVTVYVPNDPVGDFPDGAQCSRCEATLPGNAIAQTTTDEAGHFTLTNVPAGASIPLVITIGKWRRQTTISTVAACADTQVAAADSSLPRNVSQGQMPKIAISTGDADALECLVRKLGIDDTEITTDAGAGKVHLFSDTQSPGQGAAAFEPGFAGGSGPFSDSQTLWSSVDKLKTYDIVMLSCEGDQFAETKSQAHMDALKAYADLGGRVFLSHWHNIWLEGATKPAAPQKPHVWTTVATFDDGGALGDGIVDVVDETTSHGVSFATWLLNVGASPMRDQIPIQDGTGKGTATGVRGDTERWVSYQDGTLTRPQNFQFTTPYEVNADARCGKVVFSDMHVSGDSASNKNVPFPGVGAGGCSADDLTPQEKALAFMFFDIASCVSVIF